MTHEYEVSVRNIFEADSPEDALRQMVAWISENAYVAGYRVRNVDTGDEVFIDAENLTPDD